MGSGKSLFTAEVEKKPAPTAESQGELLAPRKEKYRLPKKARLELLSRIGWGGVLAAAELAQRYKRAADRNPDDLDLQGDALHANGFLVKTAVEAEKLRQADLEHNPTVDTALAAEHARLDAILALGLQRDE